MKYVHIYSLCGYGKRDGACGLIFIMCFSQSLMVIYGLHKNIASSLLAGIFLTKLIIF